MSIGENCHGFTIRLFLQLGGGGGGFWQGFPGSKVEVLAIPLVWEAMITNDWCIMGRGGILYKQYSINYKSSSSVK